MSKFSYFITFAAGALIGSVVSYRLVSKKYESIIQQEIDSVKEAFHRNFDHNNCDDKIEECVEENKEEIEFEVKQKDEYKRITQSYNPSYSKSVYYEDIYVISPDEFSEQIDHSIRSLTYFSDGVLADEVGEILSIDDTIGHESLNSIGEYEEDAVHVRNHHLKTDFEVLVDSRKYSEVFNEQS